MTALEILQAYPLGTLDVKTPDGVGKLIALPMGQMSKRIMADVLIPPRPGQRLRYDDESELYGLSDITPILRPFSSIAKGMPDGKDPAVEITKLAHGLLDGEKYTSDVSFIRDEGEVTGLYICLRDQQYNEYKTSIRAHNYDVRRLMVASISEPLNQVMIHKYLRKNHFAVLLNADQFIEKQD